MAAGSRKSGSRGSRGSRGGGGGGPRGTLGTLLRTTLAQAGVVREMLERGAREGRARLDDARQGRRRDQALARLGEAVLDAVRNGEPQVAELYDLPDVADALADLEGLEAGAEDVGEEEEEAPRERSVWVPPGIRDRFDRRPPRPPPIETDGDGTVSSKDWKQAAAKPAGERKRTPEAEPGARFAERAERAERAVPARKGGIQFTRDDDDNDEDLATYMHPDDVPPKKE
jgi:hypothetical protein